MPLPPVPSSLERSQSNRTTSEGRFFATVNPPTTAAVVPVYAQRDISTGQTIAAIAGGSLNLKDLATASRAIGETLPATVQRGTVTGTTDGRPNR